MELKNFFILICSILLLTTFVSADMDIFDNLNGTGYNATFKNFFGDFIGNGSQLVGLTESQIIDLQHTTDTNRSDAEINTLIDNRVIQSYIETLGFVIGAHTVDTNRTDADILSVASVYNETNWVLNQSYLTSETDPIFTSENSSIWNAINNKLESTDQRYNETDLINAVNTTSNIEGLGFVTGAHTIDTNRSDAEINTLIDNRVVQSYIETLGFAVGPHTIDTNRSDADILNVASVYNETNWVLSQNYLISESDPIFTSENSSIWSAIDNKLESTDQRYNETNLINSVNTTSNIEGLGFVTGPHTIDTNRSDSEINTLIDNRVIQSYIEALGFVIGPHTIDTNRSDADILSVASVYNDTATINAKLDKTDQRYNETDWVLNQEYLTSESDPNLWTSGFNSTGDDRWLDDTTIGNCSIENSCSLITYDSETTNWDKNESDDFDASWSSLTNIPSGFSDNVDNDTQYSHLSNFSDDIGVSADWDECSDANACGWITDGNTNWDNTYGFITNNVNNLINYYLKSEVYNKSEAYNKSEIDTQGKMETIWGVALATDSELAAQDECSEITGCVVGAITDGNTGWDNAYGFITNTVNDLINYYLKTDLYNKSEVYNKTEVDNSLAGQDECSEITGCVENAITDGNTNWDNTYGFITDSNDSVDSSELDNLCSTNDKILKRVSGAWQCADDATGGGGGNPFDQSLNTTDNVIFNKINANDWTNISITESQISNLDHYTDSDIDGNEAAFSGWDKNAGDDFDGTWSSLTGMPAGFSDDIDNDTTYTNGSGISLTGTQFNHSDTSSQSSSDNSGRTYIQDILLDSFGHITSIVTAVETVVDTTSFFIDTDAEASTEINEGEIVLFSDSTGMSVTRSGNTISFSTTLGTAIEKGEISNSGTLSFDWIDDEIADTLTIGSSSTVADGALSSNVPLKNAANDFSQEQTFSAGINVTGTNQLKIGACYEQWNGTCLNTYCSGTLIQSIGCA